MNKTIKLLIGILLFAVVSANTAFAISANPDGEITPIVLDIGDSQEIVVTTDMTLGGSDSNTLTVRTYQYLVEAWDGTSWVTLSDATTTGDFVYDFTGGVAIITIRITNTAAMIGDHTVGIILNDDPSASTQVSTVVETTAIPEFPTIALPVAAILGLAFIFQRRRKEE